MHISIKAETLTHLGPVPITNSLLVSILVTITFLIITFFLKRYKIKEVPGKLQNIVEIIVGGLLGFVEGITGEQGREFFPLIATFFLFILLANWSGLIPGIGSIGFHVYEHGKEIFVPLFRGATADINTTLGLAIVSVVSMQYFAVKHIGGLKFLKSRLLNPIGILEIFSDLSKIFSFAFRLFGNIFAGEVLITVIAFIIPFIVPLPFLGLELFVGFIQALVFSILTLIFINTITSVH